MHKKLLDQQLKVLNFKRKVLNLKYRALVTFSGRITKAKDEIFEISDKELVADLLNAKFIEKISEKQVNLDKEEIENEDK